MSIRKVILTGVAVLTASTGGAFAADLGFKGSVKDDGAYVPRASVQPSWYVRVDNAFATYDTPVLIEDGVETLTETGIDGSYALGFGIGHYFTSAIRGDFTYERRFETDVEGNLAHPGATLTGVRRFGLESDVFLWNLYYDFDTRTRFTPYLGVGLGFVRNETTRGVVDDCGCVTGVIAGKETYDVAAALMAGASLKLFRGFHLDAGYRFLYLGEAETGAISITERAGQPAGTVEVSDDPIVEEIHAHEFRIGLRYDFR
ncbi:MAG: outer membrane beta-barrel protein [Pseudomonadota bacterium]